MPLINGQRPGTIYLVSSPNDPRSTVPDRLASAGGLSEGVARVLSRDTGLHEADIYGVGSFYHLLARPEARVRVCGGLSCQLAGSREVLSACKAAGLPTEEISCLAACDRAPAVLRDRRTLPSVTVEDATRSAGKVEDLCSTDSETAWLGTIGPETQSMGTHALNLLGEPDWSAEAFKAANKMGPAALFDLLEESGLQGRGGAGFPAHIKWRAVAGQAVQKRYIVLNADEGEPGTFKDREVLMRRPDLVLEGLAIAAAATGASEVYLYLRGEFEVPSGVIAQAIAKLEETNRYPDITFHMHAGQGAYICGEETALLEALEGKRGMPRLKPPFPVEVGLWGKPTLVHNVETIAYIPGIVLKGGAWFKNLGRTEPGTKLYCISGHVQNPGTYELPLGISLDELVETAGGYVGTLKAFSPGGASSGFLPASERGRALDFKGLGSLGSMLGSAGVVVLNDTVNMRWAAEEQLRFFEEESCGQCAPCRIGTHYLHAAVKGQEKSLGLAHVGDVAWQMNEGSICGLGQAAALPLTSALKYFPEDFS